MKGAANMSENYNDKNIKKILESENVPEELKPESIKIMLDKFSGERKKKINIKRTVMKVVPIAAAFAVTVSTACIYFRDSFHEYKCKCIPESSLSVDASVDSMKYAADYSEVYDYFKRAERKASKIKSDGILYGNEIGAEISEEVMEDSVIGEEVNSGNFANISAEQKTDYSDTYNQEKGVLEADIVKTDGNNIYYACGNVINAVNVKDGKFLNTVQFHKDKETINDMYLYNNMLIVISSLDNYNDIIYSSSKVNGCYEPAYNDTRISFYTAGENPKLIGTYTQEGWYNDVRLTDNGYLYLVTNMNKYYNSKDFKAEEFDKYIPTYSVNNDVEYVEPDCIMIPEYCPDDLYSSSSFANISAFDLNAENVYEPADVKSVAGFSGAVYCSYENLYLTYGYEDTEITRFSISSGKITPQASGKVKGYVNDQFSMSEYNGYLRIATTINMWNNSWNDVFGDSQDYNNSLYVLDMELREVGEVKDFGIDETIKSVNFQGDTAYIVTFRQTDPLYAIDLSDPQNPVIMDEFKINGYSSYMQKWSDNLLLGFGQSADDSGTIMGVKLTMFDNTDPENLSALDSVEINADYEYTSSEEYYDLSGEYMPFEEYISSEAIWERKALLIDSEKNIIGFPVTEERYYSSANAINSESSYYIFYTFKDGHFNYLNKIKNDLEYDSFNRAIIIGDYVYALSSLQFKSADIATFENIESVTFN